MSTLPIEIWQQVCIASNTKSLKSLRLVNAALYDTASRALFAEVFVALFEYSLKNLQLIAAHLTLHKYVVKISFMSERLWSGLSYNEWKNHVDLRDGGWHERGNDQPIQEARLVAFCRQDAIVLQDDIVPKEQYGLVRRVTVSEQFLKERYDDYLHLDSEQTELASENLDIRKTVLAIRNLINVRSAKTYEIPSHSNNFLDNLLSKEKSPVPFLSRLQRATLLRDPFDGYYDYDDTPASLFTLRALETLLCAFSRDQASHLCAVKFERIPCRVWRSPMEDYWPRYKALVPKALRYVRQMDLNLHFEHRIDFYEHSVESILIPHQLDFFLSACPQLEALKLTFRYIYVDKLIGADNTTCWYNNLLDLSQTFENFTWPKLRSLELNTCAMNEATFVGLMRRHGARLETFKTNGFEIARPATTWTHAFETIAPFMSLRNVQLNGLQDHVLEQRIVAEKLWSSRTFLRQRQAYELAMSKYLMLGGNVDDRHFDSIFDHAEFQPDMVGAQKR